MCTTRVILYPEETSIGVLLEYFLNDPSEIFERSCQHSLLYLEVSITIVLELPNFSFIKLFYFIYLCIQPVVNQI